MLTMQTAKDPSYTIARTQRLLDALERRQIVTLVIEAASSCNLKCDFCDAHSGRAPKFKENAGVMKSETWDQVFSDIADYVRERGPLDMIQFHGNGEPLLNKRLPEMVGRVAGAALSRVTRVITNGVLLTSDCLNALADAGLDEIHVSLDTTDAARYDEVKKGNFGPRVLTNIQSIIPVVEARKDVQLYIKYFSEETTGIYGIDKSDTQAVVGAFGEVCRDSRFVHLKHMPLVNVGEGMLQGDDRKTSPCEVPFYTLYVMHTGKVSACCSDVFSAMTVGRMVVQSPSQTRSSLLEIVDSDPLFKIRKTHLDGRCNEIKLCAGCGNRTTVDLSQLPAQAIDALHAWIDPATSAAR